MSTDALIDSSLLQKQYFDAAFEIIYTEINVRLSMGDFPLPDILKNWSFSIKENSPGHYSALGENDQGNQVSRDGNNVDLLMAQAIVDAIQIQNQIAET